MKKIKHWLQKILLYLLKKLNMPKIFAQFSYKDLRNIDTIISETVKVPLHRTSYINDEVAVLEYSEAKDNQKDIDEQHYEAIANPQKTINIFSPDFRLLINGFDEDTEYVYDTLNRYLLNNDFLQ